MSANDFRLRDGIRFHPIPCGGSGEERYYRLELETASDNIVGLDALEDRLLTAGLNLRVSAVENILNTLFDVLPAYIAETGNAVRIGNLVTLKPCVTGTLAHANDAADPEKNHLEIRATVVPALRRMARQQCRRGQRERRACLSAHPGTADRGTRSQMFFRPCLPLSLVFHPGNHTGQKLTNKPQLTQETIMCYTPRCFIGRILSCRQC